MAKALVIVALVLIVASLFSALAMLFRGSGGDTRVARALTVRVALSVTLFLTLMAGFYFGWIPRQGL